MMRLKSYKHILKVCLAVAIVVAVLPNIAGAKRMWKMTEPMVTYYAGPPINDVSVQLMKDGGWNVIWCNENELDIAQKYGLKAFLRDGLLYPTTMEDPAKVKQLEALVERVKNHPALEAYFIVDEPNTSVFPNIAKMVALLKKHDPAHFGYVNLFPTYASNEQLGNTGDVPIAYLAHLEQFIKEVKPLMLSYDNYQFFVLGDGDQYFLNLELVRQTAVKHNLPFMNIIQASSWTPSVRVPNADEFRFLYYTTIAYGAKAISHYVYNYPVQHEGMIVTNDGTPTHLYHAAKYLNRDFRAIVSELFDLKSQGAFHVGTMPPGTSPVPDGFAFKIEADNLAGVTSELEKDKAAKGYVMGTFGKDKKTTHVVVVNLDYTKGQKATITGPGKLEVFIPATNQWYPTLSNSAELDMLAGGGVLVRLADSK